MDDITLATQYAQTGNLMDLCSSEAWLQESTQIEDEGQIEAGLAAQHYSQQMNALTPAQSQQLYQQMRVQSMLFGALHQWMGSWNLGASFEDTYTVARRLVRYHLANFTPLMQDQVQRLLRDYPHQEPAHPLVQQQLMAILLELLTPEDFQVMAETASRSMASQVIAAKRLTLESAVVKA
jgi:hypothetical protein